MPYCGDCKHLTTKKKRETRFGVWDGVCEEYDIGRNDNTPSCPKYEERENTPTEPPPYNEHKKSHGESEWFE